MITGEISDENHVLADGKIVLSRNGAEKLINEIKRSFELDK
ncbi:transcriptional regulator [Caldifermentibacillus hisashii]